MTNLLRGIVFYNDLSGTSSFIPALKITELVKILNSKLVIDCDKLSHELYTIVANYDIKHKACWLKLEKSLEEGINLTWGIADLVELEGVPSDLIIKAYELWKTSTCTPEQACKKLGLTMEELMALADKFESLNAE